MNTIHLHGLIFITLSCTLALPGLAEEQGDKPEQVRVGLASLRRAKDISDGVSKIKAALVDSGKQEVDIVCLPELYLPGMRGFDKKMPELDQPGMQRAINDLAVACRDNNVGAIIGVEWLTENGLENRAFVIDRHGKVLGYQTKNQITPGWESESYVADGKRQMFELDGVRLGISICHEGWRYPETVRWAAVRGAQVVFQPQATGSDYREPAPPTKWGDSFYEKAMTCRAEENSVYFVSVNRAMRLQNSSSSVVDPDGNLVDHTPRGKEELLVVDLDLTKATGFYAGRYKPHLYEEHDEGIVERSADPRSAIKKSVQPVNSKVPTPQEITEIIIQRGVTTEPHSVNKNVHLIRADSKAQFDRLASTLVNQGFFELSDSYGKAVPDGPRVAITVIHGDNQKTVTRLFENELDNAWQFEMLIRGVASQIRK